MNRLGDTASPYLQQHAHNPVPWWEWGEAALAEARATDRPILLSVGYAACHWCHVMERESFTDPAIGALMGDAFVCIKVDREERPDVDEVYMRAVQVLQRGHGGWPMTVFLTPDGRPFWGGTYFPPEPRHGVPSFRAVLERMARLWRTHRDDVERHADEIVGALRRGDRPPPSADPPGHLVADVARGVAADFDREHGGFGGAPKFPPHGTLAILVAAAAQGDRAALDTLVGTLQGLTRGGTYDLVEGGFHRYSVDAAWVVPHFEKMLYDQAQLVPVLIDAWLLTGSSAWAVVAEETLGFVLTRLDLPDGGFAASTDADTEGHEGTTFTWTPEELAAIEASDAAVAARLFGVTAEGTFENGRSVLRLPVSRDRLCGADLATFVRWRTRLATARSQRPQPSTDDKCVAAWAAAMGSAFVRAGLALNRPDYVVRGVRAADFLYGPMAPNGNLARSWRAGRTGPPAFADDIAARGTLALDLFEATGNLSWLDRAVADADDLVARFHSADGLTTTASDSRPHVWTPYNATGSAEPSPVALAALLASRLDALCGRPDLGAVSDALCQSRVALARHAPRAVGAEAIAASRRALGGREVILTGPDTEALRAALHATVDPYRVVAWLPDGPDVRVPASTGRSTSRATAWVCAGSTCLPPVGEAADLAAALRQPLARAAPLPAAPTASARVWAPRERRRDAPADVTLASLCTPEGLAVQGDDLWIADTGAHRIVRYRLDEGADGWPVVVDRRAWGDGVPGLVDGCAPRFQMPRGLAVAGSRVWICDTGNHAIRVLDPENGSVQTVAGTGVEGAPGRVDPARPLETPLRTPWSIAGNADALFVGMATDHRIWILLPAERRFGPWAGDGRRHGADGTLADAGLGTPLALAAGDGWLFALDADAGTLRAIDFESGRVGTVPVAGTPWAGPEGLTVLGGAAFVSVTGADAVVRVDLVDGTSTPVGSGWSGPRGMAVWRDTVLVADSEAHRVVAVRTDGQCRRVG